ncbi:hypothetical protein PCLA_22f0042 [Pseudomonas citronellolis]|nr:hypothetical protein PCLA_22f0042 [Pseudomonas citronellolis]
MTPNVPFTPDSPLSLTQGEGWGEGTAPTRNTVAAGKHRSRASSLLRKAPSRPSRGKCPLGSRVRGNDVGKHDAHPVIPTPTVGRITVRGYTPLPLHGMSPLGQLAC